MTVREYLAINNRGIESIGIYDATGEGLAIHANAKNILPYSEEEIKEVDLGIFDETRKDIFGKEYNAKYIRACIYLKMNEKKVDLKNV